MKLIYLSQFILLIAFVAIKAQANILSEGFVFARNFKQAEGESPVEEETASPTTEEEVSPEETIFAPPPPLTFAPPPYTITDRALLLNTPFELGETPGDFITLEPTEEDEETSEFTVTSLTYPPPLISEADLILSGETTYNAAPPDVKDIIDDIGGVIDEQVAPEAKQSFVNLLTPDIKNEVPTVSQAIEENGLETGPPPTSGPGAPGTPGGPPAEPAGEPPGEAGASLKFSMSLLTVVAALLYLFY